MGDLKRVVHLLEIATRDEREACAKICDDEAAASVLDAIDASAPDCTDWIEVDSALIVQADGAPRARRPRIAKDVT
jgi:hypothetical protein